MRKTHPVLRAVAKLGWAVVVLLAISSPVMGCPMCKDSVVDSASAASVPSSGLDFNKSIYIMLGGLVCAVGFTGRVMFKAVKLSDESSGL
jgi:hypothetical protein